MPPLLAFLPSFLILLSFLIIKVGSFYVAAIAQLVEHRIVIPVVAGSSPVGRPNFLSLGWEKNKFLQ